MSRVAVIIPCYCVEDRIQQTLTGVPSSVELIVVVDDKSTDRTLEVAHKAADHRTIIVEHDENRGVGAAILSGYECALSRGADVLVVMAGDNQMCPSDLPRLLEPIERGQADYVKGNRLLHPEWQKMPVLRRLGTRFLAWLTSRLSGLRIGDSQCGYTALSRKAAEQIPLSELWPRYGYPGHLLLTLAQAGLRVSEVPVRPIYQGERSGLRPWHVLYIAGVVCARALTLKLRRLGLQSAAAEGQR